MPSPELTDSSASCTLSDLIGELPEVQPVSNISTAADLLKQGAGEFSAMPSLSENTVSHSMLMDIYTLLKWSSIFLQP